MHIVMPSPIPLALEKAGIRELDLQRSVAPLKSSIPEDCETRAQQDLWRGWGLPICLSLVPYPVLSFSWGTEAGQKLEVVQGWV